MRFTFILGLVICLALTGVAQAESFEFRVKHDHTLGSCEGKLMANDREIGYEAADGKHSQTWAYIDIQKLDVASPTRLVLTTFQNESWKKLKKTKCSTSPFSRASWLRNIKSFSVGNSAGRWWRGSSKRQIGAQPCCQSGIATASGAVKASCPSKKTG